MVLRARSLNSGPRSLNSGPGGRVLRAGDGNSLGQGINALVGRRGGNPDRRTSSPATPIAPALAGTAAGPSAAARGRHPARGARHAADGRDLRCCRLDAAQRMPGGDQLAYQPPTTAITRTLTADTESGIMGHAMLSPMPSGRRRSVAVSSVCRASHRRREHDDHRRASALASRVGWRRCECAHVTRPLPAFREGTAPPSR